MQQSSPRLALAHRPFLQALALYYPLVVASRNSKKPGFFCVTQVLISIRLFNRHLDPMANRHLGSLHIILLFILLSLAYHEVRHHHFVWDTIPFVLENPWIHEWSIANLTAMFTESHRANWHPLVLLSHAADFSLFGNDAGKHHLVNLALHITDSILLMIIVRVLLVMAGQDQSSAQWVGFLTALIFGLHPQHVESVAWVVERKDVLYTLFIFIALLLYLKLQARHIAADDERTPTRSWGHHLWPFAFFCLAVMSKPMAVTFPVILLLVDIYPLNRARSLQHVPSLVLEKLHYFIIGLLVSLVTLATQATAMPDNESLPLWARCLNALDNTSFYVKGYIWPVNLSPFYPYPQNAAYLASYQFWLPGLLFLTSLSTLVLWQWTKGRTWPLLLFGFYLVTLLPASGLIHVGPAKATDHYVYMATIPLSLLTALLIVSFAKRSSAGRILSLALASSYLAGLLLLTQLQVSYWNNPLSLWSRVTQLYPDSAFGHRNLAAAYVQVADWQLALQHAERSLALGSPDVDYVIRLRSEVQRQQSNNDL